MSSTIPGSGGLEILSDTQGVDFAQYMKKAQIYCCKDIGTS